MEIIKVLKDTVQDIDLPMQVEEVYLLKNQLDIVGYGFINYDSSNEIEMFIKEDYRGEENGKLLFKKLYKDFKKGTIRLEIDINNYPMLKIVEEFGGTNLGAFEGKESYVIKKN